MYNNIKLYSIRLFSDPVTDNNTPIPSRSLVPPDGLCTLSELVKLVFSYSQDLSVGRPPDDLKPTVR